MQTHSELADNENSNRMEKISAENDGPTVNKESQSSAAKSGSVESACSELSLSELSLWTHLKMTRYLVV